MVRPVGLRAEIIINISLLVAAALLFVSFLLLRLTERELLEERLHRLRNIMDVLSQGVDLASPETFLSGNAVQSLIPSETGILSIYLADRDLNSLRSTMVTSEVDRGELRRVRSEREASIKIRYVSLWSPFGENEENVAVITVPVLDNQHVSGVLQARFSLADIHHRIVAAQRLVLVYVALYGGVLLLFGIYLLGRTVVTPVRRLMTASARVAAGNLDQPLDLKGPKEILELADSFNTMQEALKESQKETRETIQSLEQANHILEKTRDELVRSERMASVGHLAAGMAHEIGNPLGAVIGYLELLKNDAPCGMARELVERTTVEACRIDRLVRDLLNFAIPVASEPETLDPAGTFAEARDLLLHQGIFELLRLRDKLPPSLPLVRIDRHQLIQVLVNFLLNARDASAPGGEIHLAGGAQGDSVWLAVRDQGEGIPPEILPHLFDPFFTTKEPGKGCGLGLSVCHRIATDAGGRIEVRSVTGGGSEFILWLKKVTDNEA